MSLGGVSNSNVVGIASQFGLDLPLGQSEPKMVILRGFKKQVYS